MNARGRIASADGLTTTVLQSLAKTPVSLTCKQLMRRASADPADHALYKNYLSTLARLTRAGRVERSGATKGTWQHRPEVTWKITSAGKVWMWDMEDRRWRHGEQVMVACALGAVAEATPRMSKQQRADAARGLMQVGASKQDVARVLGDKAAYVAAAGVKYAKPAPRVPFGPEHPSFEKVAGYLSAETGVKTGDIMNMWQIMRNMGLMVVMPPAWRCGRPDGTDDEPSEAGAQS